MDDLKIRVTSDKLIAVEGLQSDWAPVKYYSLPFICVSTTSDGEFGSLLICAGGSGPSMARIKEKSDELFQKLESLLRPTQRPGLGGNDAGTRRG